MLEPGSHPPIHTLFGLHPHNCVARKADYVAWKQTRSLNQKVWGYALKPNAIKDYCIYMGGACQYERLFLLSGPVLKLAPHCYGLLKLGPTFLFFKAPPTHLSVYSHSLSPSHRFNFEILPYPFPVHSYALVHVAWQHSMIN